MKTNHAATDIIVIGSGIAGLYCALTSAEHSNVTVITKSNISESNSYYAQGGIAAVLDPLDDFFSHIEDTLNAGAYANTPEIVEHVVQQAPHHIHRLIELGVQFNQHNEQLDLTQEGGHSYRRIVHAQDATGKEVEHALIQAVRAHENITVVEHLFAVDLITHGSSKQVIGVETISNESNVEQTTRYMANAVVLASGGAGQLYAVTSNPVVATGDGIAMAQRAGAEITGMEFIQFHPTTLQLDSAPHFLLSEALRGEGAKLCNAVGEQFMQRYDERLELAPRDIVSRAVAAELVDGPVYLDMTHLAKHVLIERFPTIYAVLEGWGLRLERDLIPISPAAHYVCGGIATDIHGATSLPGLYAIGEAANTGLHGANRLASNSLLECLVFATAASNAVKQTADGDKDEITSHSVEPIPVTTLEPVTTKQLQVMRNAVQELMWSNVGITRTTAGLTAAHKQLTEYAVDIEQLRLNGTHVDIEELRNLIECGLLTTTHALARPDSLGAHYRVN